jgi:hypothetical protein
MVVNMGMDYCHRIGAASNGAGYVLGWCSVVVVADLGNLGKIWRRRSELLFGVGVPDLHDAKTKDERGRR